MQLRFAISFLTTMTVLLPLHAQSSGGLPIVNDTSGAIELWVLKERQPFRETRIFVQRGQTKTLDLSVPGRYHLTAREADSLREFLIGVLRVF